MAAPDTSVSRTADAASAVDNGDDVVAFVVGDGQHKLYFSKRALMRHAPFFRAYFTEHAAEAAAASGGGSGGTTVVLRHVKPRSAEAALRLCHSAHHSDDGLFWSLQRECEKADAAHKPEALRAVLSLYAACVKFELHEHAKAASATAAGAVTAHTVYDVLKTCARYATTLLPEMRRAVGLDVLLAACYAFVRTHGAWQGERRWRRLYEQYPELSEIVAAASAATATPSAHGEGSASAAAGGSPSPQRRVLLSPQKESAAAGSSATVMPESAAPLPDVFAGHLRQTEGLALAAQWRCRSMSAEVTALRESCAALEATAQRDEAAAAEVELYLGEVRVYVQALGCAETEMQQLCASAAVMCAAPSSSAAAASTLHELRYALQRASAWAAERKAAVDELLALEQDAREGEGNSRMSDAPRALQRLVNSNMRTREDDVCAAENDVRTASRVVAEEHEKPPPSPNRADVVRQALLHLTPDEHTGVKGGMFPVDPAHESALADPLFMLRLYKRVAYGLVRRPHADGARALLPSFLSVDARYVESNNAAVDAAELLTAVEPIFPTSLLTNKEVCLLLRVLPLGEEESTPSSENEDSFGVAQRGRCSSVHKGIRPGSVTLALREIIPFRTWQVSQTVATVRRTVQKSAVMSPFEEHVVDLLDWQSSRRRQATEAAPPPLERWEALAFMENTCGLSSSESRGLLHYCASEEGDSAEDGAATGSYLGCEVQLLHQLLFSETIPGVAEYPLLMGRFAEATLEIGETDGCHTGTLALLSVLELIELHYPERSRRLSPDLDIGALVRAELTPRHFFYVCTRLRTGFRQEESDQLYYYLKKDRETDDGVLVADLLAAYRQYFPSVTVSMLQLVQAAVVQWIRRNAKDAPAFVQLYSALREWGAAHVPIKSFIKALRAAGVPDGISGVLDVELEWLRLKSPTRVDLLLMLCSPVPPSRAAIIRKLFDRLDERRLGTVACAVVLRCFHPELIEGNALRRQGTMWKKALEAYAAELGEGELDYDVFAYFWYMISADIEDDPTFTMALWQAFGLSDDGQRSRRT